MEYMSGVAGEAAIDNEAHAILADDDHVVALFKTSASRNGRTFHGNAVYVFHVSDGRITEALPIPADQYDFDEFWAAAARLTWPRIPSPSPNVLCGLLDCTSFCARSPRIA